MKGNQKNQKNIYSVAFGEFGRIACVESMQNRARTNAAPLGLGQQALAAQGLGELLGQDDVTAAIRQIAMQS